MVARIKTTNTKAASVRVKAPQTVTVSVQQVGEALGAESAKTVAFRGSPPALLALRRALHEQLCSTGGRPGLKGATRRQKIPLRDEDWERLQRLAEQYQDSDMHPTPGQVAGVLLRQVLDALQTEAL